MSKWGKVSKLSKLSASADPFASMPLSELKAERCQKLVWDVEAEKWQESVVMVKMEGEQFQNGAQRACYRAKEMDAEQFMKLPDWKKAENVVVKKYMSPAARDVYENDVRMQMVAKSLGEKYNKRNPPKKVDFMLTYMLVTLDREEEQVYCAEHFLEGNYEKYNNNSGYVAVQDSDEEQHVVTIRNTPNTFSHFSFLESKHSMIVVDIQGVADLYTDPQIHTVKGDDFGQGNLGVPGLALFFNTHQCNPLCKSLGLEEFSRYHVAGFALAREWASSTLSKTFSRLQLDQLPTLAAPPKASEAEASPHPLRRVDLSNTVVDLSSLITSTADEMVETDEERLLRQQRLGLIHHQTARYFETGRLSEDGATPDHRASFFHLQQASSCGLLSGLMGLARIYSGLPRDVLPEVQMEDDRSCFRCMKRAALLHPHPYPMYHLAQMLHEGRGTSKSYKQAAEWYQKALNLLWQGEPPKRCGVEDEVTFYGYEECLKPHVVAQKLAELHAEGGDDLEPNKPLAVELYREAAEAAMEAMLGKLSMKLYARADELEAEVEAENE